MAEMKPSGLASETDFRSVGDDATLGLCVCFGGAQPFLFIYTKPIP